MKMRKLGSIVLAGALLTGIVAQATAAPKPTELWTDDSGDADVGQGLGGSIPAGWDIASGSVVKKGGDLLFTVAHHDMPPFGSAPEISRFLWNFTVNGDPYRFTVKSADIGKPDIPAGQTTERVGRVDLQGHFRLEGECTENAVGVTFVNCPPVAYLDGSWDPGAKSFTIVLPLKTVKAKVGSVIGPGGVQICGICWVSHTAERSSGNTIIDEASQAVFYKVPKK